MHPKLHLSPPKNWCNDPVGFIYYQGHYHLFYQYFPYGCTWGTMHWRHAMSDDLVHWEDLGIALYPSKPYDQNGCFSGSSIEVNKQLYIYYTSVQYTKAHPQNIHITASGNEFLASQSMIISSNGLHFDNIQDKKMIIPVFNDNEIGHPTHTRDPKVWKYQGTYYMVLASQYLDQNQQYQGQLLFYTSKDAINWQYKNYFRNFQLGDMWECPDIFEINQQQCLIMSPERTESHGYPSHARIATCLFKHKHCEMKITSKLRFLDYGKDLYAPQTTIDKDGNRIYIGWMRMPKPVDNWCGLFTFPRVIEYKDNHIYTKPHPSIQQLFHQQRDNFDYQIPTHIYVQLNQNDFINIGGYKIKYYQCLTVDRTEVFISTNTIDLITQTPNIASCYLDIYIDQNIIEIYINDGYYVLSHIIYHLDNYIDCSTSYLLETL